MNAGTMSKQIHARPFLKWAGGKRQLLDGFGEFYPEGLGKEINIYIEPFVGGGAVYFRLAEIFGFDECHIADNNRDLMLAYRVVRDDTGSLIERMHEIEELYLPLAEEERREFYYRARTEYNGYIGVSPDEDNLAAAVEHTALLIFLNRTCYNGLYRVNSMGEFNVPFGRYKKPSFPADKVLRVDAAMLVNTTIHTGDFTTIKEHVGEHTFIYFDPPYRPLNRTSSFSSYSSGGFGEDDQRRLAEFFIKCSNAGASCMLSNSDPGDGFLEELYRDFSIRRVPARRSINSDKSGRGEITEIVVTNY